MRGRTIDLSAYNKLLKYPIKRDGLDFMLYAEITFHSSGNHRKELNTFMKIELNMETEQGSGVMRKINEPFTVAGTFPDWL